MYSICQSLICVLFVQSVGERDISAQKEVATQAESFTTEESRVEKKLQATEVPTQSHRINTDESPIEKLRQEQDQERQKQDLIAQQSMAKSAHWTVVINVVSILVSIFGLVFVFRSLRTSQTAVEVAKDALESQSRAWIGFSIRSDICLPTAKIELSIPLRLNCTIKNHGQSPAIVRNFLVELLVRTPGLDHLVCREQTKGEFTVFHDLTKTIESKIELEYIAYDRFANSTDLKTLARISLEYESVSSSIKRKAVVTYLLYVAPPDSRPLEFTPQKFREFPCCLAYPDPIEIIAT